MANFPTLRQLRHLVALAETRHFGRAALACHVTQSTLSVSIRSLEETLGAPLFDRNRRKIAFTPLGDEIVARAQRILLDTEDLVQAARAAREPLGGTIRMGVIPTIGPFLLPSMFRRLRKAYPKLRLLLREDRTDRLLALLEAGELDVLILALPCAHGGAKVQPLFTDKFVVAFAAGHRLEAKSTVRAADLAGENVLLLNEGHCLREHALAACQGTRTAQSESFAATSLHTLVQMIDGGVGVTLLPAIAVAAGIVRGTNVVTRPLTGGDNSRQIGLAWRAHARRRSEYELLGRELKALLERG